MRVAVPKQTHSRLLVLTVDVHLFSSSFRRGEHNRKETKGKYFQDDRGGGGVQETEETYAKNLYLFKTLME